MSIGTRIVLLLIVIVSTGRAAEVESVSEERWFFYSSLLVTTDSDLLKIAAKGIIREPVNDHRLHEHIALVLSEHLEGKRLINQDTRAWLAKALGPSRSKRYRPLLEAVAADPTTSLARHVAETLPLLDTEARAFVPSDVDVVAISAELERLRGSGNEIRPSLFTARSGMTMEQIIRNHGYPDSIEIGLRMRAASYARFSVSNAVFVYESRGRIELEHATGDWRSSLITPELPERFLNGEPEVVEVRRGLLDPEFSMFRVHTQTLRRRKYFDRDTLELAAWRLIAHLHVTEPILVDGLAHLSVALGDAGDPRYREILQTVSTDADEQKLRRRATRALEQLGPAEAPQFDGMIR